MGKFAEGILTAKNVSELNNQIEVHGRKNSFPKTAAKLVDEYNWIKVTRGLEIRFKYSLKDSFEI